MLTSSDRNSRFQNRCRVEIKRIGALKIFLIRIVTHFFFKLDIVAIFQKQTKNNRIGLVVLAVCRHIM